MKYVPEIECHSFVHFQIGTGNKMVTFKRSQRFLELKFELSVKPV